MPSSHQGIDQAGDTQRVEAQPGNHQDRCVLDPLMWAGRSQQATESVGVPMRLAVSPLRLDHAGMLLRRLPRERWRSDGCCHGVGSFPEVDVAVIVRLET
jgi:hypothetical protein